MKRKLGILAVIVAVLLAAFTVHTLWIAGAFLTLEPKAPEPLRIVEGLAGGSEDMVLRRGSTQAFVSSANFRDCSQSGGIFLVDLATGSKRDVTPAVDFPMCPHGIDIFIAPGGAERLFVVNHRNGSGFTPSATNLGAVEHTIELFDVMPDDALVHVGTVRGDLLFSPNDVAAVGPTSFYVSNDHGWPPGFARVLEDFLRLPLSNVVYYDGQSFREVHSGAIYANGVLASRDLKHLYLAESGGRFTRFKRLPDGELEPEVVLDRLGGLDNISLDDQGRPWIASHPKLLQFVDYATDPDAKQSPTQVLRLSPDADGYAVEQMYLSLGEPMSAATVALPFDGGVALGAVFEDAVVVLPPIR